MIPIVATLLQSGLSLLGNAVLAKGKDAVEKKLGIKLEENPTQEQLLQYTQAQLEHEEELMKIQHEDNKLDLEHAKVDAGVVTTVNQTMQTEAKSERWPQYGWRPFIGFQFGLYIMSLWVLPLMDKVPTTLSTEIVLAIGGILGVASWFRGQAQVEAEKKS